MKRNLIHHTAIAGALFFSALSTQAAVVSSWDYKISLTWDTTPGATTFTGGSGSQSISSTAISWGSSSSPTDPASNTDRSGLKITDTPAQGAAITNGGPATTNTITHYNHSISGNYATLKAAKLIAKVELNPTGLLPVPAPPVVDLTNPFAIYFVETANTPPCLTGSTSTCDDAFVLTMGALNHSFVYDGNTYFASIFEKTNQLKPLDPTACTAAGSSIPCIGFMTAEGAVTPAQFAFTITTRELTVPEPGALALLGLGLGILGLRRPKNQPKHD